MKKNIHLSNLIIYFFCCLSLLLSFYFNEDGSYLPFSADFKVTWRYVLSLKENFLSDPYPHTVHYPLHYYLLSRLDLIFNNPLIVRLVICFVSMIIPYIFFVALREKYKNKNINILFIICLSIFFIPAFRYSSVWANDRITTDIFILLGCYFFFKYEFSRIKNLKFLYISFLLFALACYSRQFYVVYYALFIIYIFRNDSLKNFINLSIYSAILSLPGFYLLYKFPYFLSGLAYSGNIFNTMLGNVSKLFVYTFPLIIINILFNKKNNNLNLKNILIYSIISLSIFAISYLNHDLSTMGANGGVFFILSKKIFGNYILFYLIFIINFIFILQIFDNYKDRFIIFSFVFIFCSIIVPQSVYEPLIFLYFFLFAESKFKNIFLENKNASFALLAYYIMYYLIAVTDIAHKVKLY